jgi:mannosyltransferase
MDLSASNAIATGTETAPGPSTVVRSPVSPRARPKRWRSALDGRLGDVAVVVAPGLLAAALCFVGITARSLGFDESATVAIVSQHGAALRHGIAHDGGNMAGYYVLLHALVSVFGNGLLVLRLPSALGIAVAAAVTSLLGLRLFDRRAALIAGLLTALSVSLVFWGQSARSYALLVTFASASFMAFVALVDLPGGGRTRRGGWMAWLGYVLFSALAMYMSLMAALVVVAQLATFRWWWRRRGWAVVSALLTIGVACIPLVLLAIARGSGQLSWVSSPGFPDVEQVLEAITGAGLQPSIRATATTLLLLWLTVAGLLVIAAVIGVALRRNGTRREMFGPSLLLSWLVVPVLLAWVESLVAQPLFLPRNLLYGVPAAALLLACAITRRRLAPAIALSCLVVLVALRALQVAPTYGVSPEDWRGATAFVLQRGQPGDCVAFYPSDGRMAFQYYLASGVGGRHTLVPRPVLPAAPWNRVVTYIEDYVAPPPTAVSQLPASCPRLWFISTHQGRRGGSPAAQADYHRYIGLRAALEDAYPTHLVRLFGYASAVHVELLGR